MTLLTLSSTQASPPQSTTRVSRVSIILLVVNDSMIKVAALYDFSARGSGNYTFTPMTNFVFVNDNAKEQTVDHLVKAEVAVTPVEITITGGTEKRDVTEKRATVSCPIVSNNAFITAR